MQYITIVTIIAPLVFDFTLGLPTESVQPVARQSAVFAASLLSSLWKPFAQTPPPCSEWFPEGYDYYINSGQSENGLYWAACWMNASDTTPFYQPEVDVATCLAGLHSTQADTCISVSGSSCDNGYVAGGGRLQNLREPVFGSGYQSDAQISSDANTAIAEAIASLNGQLVTGLNAFGPYFISNSAQDFQSPADGNMPIQVNWIGETAC